MELVDTVGANCYATAILFDTPDDLSRACNPSDARHGFRVCVRNNVAIRSSEDSHQPEVDRYKRSQYLFQAKLVASLTSIVKTWLQLPYQ